MLLMGRNAMLLRRVMENVRDQNWTAVGLDFLIVVIGLLVGFQIDRAWQDIREQQIAETYLIRIHEELVAANESYNESITRGNIEQVLRIHAISQQIFNGEDTILPAEDCLGLFFVHTYFNVPPQVPALQEMAENGILSDIDSYELIAAFTRFLIRETERDTRYETLSAGGGQPLRTIFPQYFNSILSPNLHEQGGNEFRLQWESGPCDAAGMRADPHFKEVLMEQLARYDYYLGSVVDEMTRDLSELHVLVDAHLEITH